MAKDPFVVMPTIHGPAGYSDVVIAASGIAVAVCPRKANARRIAALLSEHQFCQVPAPKRRAKK